MPQDATAQDATAQEWREHPGFARAWLRLAPLMELLGTGAHRRDLLADLTGEVCEVGAGSGSNFAYYPRSVVRVVAIEPDPRLRFAAAAEAQRVRRHQPLPHIVVIAGTAASVPVAGASFDAVVSCLVLCSVQDQHQALTEMRRVLRPGGHLALYEHVRSTIPLVARIQDTVAPGWAKVAGGCHPNRATIQAVADAGFALVTQREQAFPAALPGLPHITCHAVRD